MTLLLFGDSWLLDFWEQKREEGGGRGGKGGRGGGLGSRQKKVLEDRRVGPEKRVDSGRKEIEKC